MIIITAAIAFIASLIEATFLQTAKIAGGSIELCTVLIIIFIFFGSFRFADLFLIFSAMFLNVFSKIPLILFLLPNFLIVAIFSYLFNKRLLSKPTTFFSFPLFFAAILLTDFTKLAILAEFSLSNISSILASSFYSALFATIIYYLINKIYLYFNPRIAKEIIKLAE